MRLSSAERLLMMLTLVNLEHCVRKKSINVAYTTGLGTRYRKEYIKYSIDLILILEVMNDNRTTSEKLCGCKIKMSVSHIDIEKEIEF